MLEVVQFRELKDGKWAVQNVGYAKKNDKGGLDVTLTALPMPNQYGVARVVVQQKRQNTSHAADRARQEPQDTPLDDEIPGF